MTNTIELEKAIFMSKKTKREIAKVLCLSEQAFYNKLNNRAEFKASEIDKLKTILALSSKQRDIIFFA